MRPPFSWLCHQEPLPWHGDQLLVVSYCYMPMDLIGWLVMRPTILQLGLDLLFFMGPFVSCWESFYFFLGDSWVKHLNVSFFGFYLLPATFTLWAFSPFFPQGKLQPLDIWPTQCTDQCNGMDEREKMESGKYGGNRWWPFMNPPMANQTLWEPNY